MSQLDHQSLKNGNAKDMLNSKTEHNLIFQDSKTLQVNVLFAPYLKLHNVWKCFCLCWIAKSTILLCVMVCTWFG